MRSPMSPIRDFYPEDFQIDYEGKRADWEGVALICFIDEVRERGHAGPGIRSLRHSRPESL